MSTINLPPKTCILNEDKKRYPTNLNIFGGSEVPAGRRCCLSDAIIDLGVGVKKNEFLMRALNEKWKGRARFSWGVWGWKSRKCGSEKNRVFSASLERKQNEKTEFNFRLLRKSSKLQNLLFFGQKWGMQKHVFLGCEKKTNVFGGNIFFDGILSTNQFCARPLRNFSFWFPVQ